MKTIKAGIAGGAGYTGGEMIRLLMHHPHVELVFVSSRSQAGKKLSDIHEDLLGQSDLEFTNAFPRPGSIDVLFLCLPHGSSVKYLEEAGIGEEVKIIDLSRDFRLDAPDNPFIYGLPELNRDKITAANRIANPGCFATAIQLALLPLAASDLLRTDIHVSAITGSTGAGVGLLPTTHFTWRNNNISVYKAFRHQHLTEINQTISHLQPAYEASVNFIPYRGNFSRGIIATVYTDYDAGIDAARDVYGQFYSNAPFVNVTPENLHLKQVVNTNHCFLHLEKHDNKLMIVSIIDNLLKGASGQALQNLNLIMGWEETTGLQLKASVF